ncbi:RHS repeat domain-containing protein [Luteimonas fraxinea]|uniref:RHS repeat-associated core domain-containing protein n=1 Tax=Luteimonas fraxinea TaxID=2901869 RepID=A0ABS8UB08_9GAMM|nr:RHS repeat-associated core domain-containing protein [Luteimonas fraxinea]MCD9096681.1 RHS repeat-associated core domain-containing protein [Luteimonas fraxinea]MCD9126051.1 RHS repeat-associated core domain-containing protein [Luteimonas fraxinea]
MKNLFAYWVAMPLLIIGMCSPVNAQTVIKYVHTDALGSVVAMSNQSGSITQRREYEPFGAQLSPALQDGPGYTGHIQDAATGLTYMQQRYFDSGLGQFLSVDPVTALGGDMRHFNRYGYAFNNPYTLSDPDGRAPCTGSKIGTCVNGFSIVGLSDRQIRGIKNDPQAYINKLNTISNGSKTIPESNRYFKRVAQPVTAVTGREVGANLAMWSGFDPGPYSIVDFELGDHRSVEAGKPYLGPGTRVGIIHTHPTEQNFSGAGHGTWSDGKYRGSFSTAVENDLNRALSAGVNAYVVMRSGGILKFDFEAMSRDTARGAPLDADDYITRMP